MSVSSSTSRSQYSGNNSTVTAYVVPFQFAANDDLVVVVTSAAGVATTLIDATDYTLIGAENPAGGSFTTAVAVAVASTVTVYSEVAITQPVVYVENADFPASTQEAALDRVTRICQQIDRAANASVRVSDVEGDRDELVPVANTMLGLNASKMPITKTVDELKSFLALSGTTLAVNAGMKTFADAGERGLAVPEFTGQLGTQRDTQVLYISSGTSAGNWVSYQTLLASFSADEFTADTAGRLPFADGIWDAAKIAADAVTTAKIAADAVTTAKVLDANVTAAKLAAALDLSSKTLTMPSDHWKSIAPAGSILQVVQASYTANALITTPYIPHDDTIPQISEGTQILSQAITPFSASNTILVIFQGQSYMSNNAAPMAAIFRDSVVDAISMRDMYPGAALNQAFVSFVIHHIDSPATTSSTTYTVRAAPNSSGNMYFNGATLRTGGGASAATLTLMEIKG